MTKMEYRSFGAAILAGDGRNINGLAAPFNSETMIGQAPWGFREKIAPGAFAKTIKEADVVFLFNHDSGLPLARKSAGTLSLSESERGLEVNADPPETTYANDLRTNIKSGNVKGMSFAFEVVKEDWYDDKGEESNRYDGTLRVLREVKLREVSAVTFPAYETTSISARDAVSAARGDAEDRAGKAPYGDVAYADPGFQADKQKRYPIDTKKHVKAALAYIAKAKNAAKYTAEQLSHIKSAITAAAKKFGIKVSDSKAAEYVLDGYCPQHGYEPCGEDRCEDAWDETRDGDGAAEGTPDDDAEERMKASTKKRIPQIDADLRAALDLFAKCKPGKLPPKAQQAVALVASAKTHTAHVMDHEGLEPGDAARGAEPGDPTPPPPTPSDDDALRAAFAQARSRGLALGF